jgi:hypothetical protein
MLPCPSGRFFAGYGAQDVVPIPMTDSLGAVHTPPPLTRQRPTGQPTWAENRGATIAPLFFYRDQATLGPAVCAQQSDEAMALPSMGSRRFESPLLIYAASLRSEARIGSPG